MELALNLAWLALGVWMVCLWLRFAPQTGHDRRVQLVALAMALIILWPVISVTDDLTVAARNPAEVDCSMSGARKGHDWAAPHSVVPTTTALVVAFFAGLLAPAEVSAPREHSAPRVSAPALASIQNRPPPAA